jgi:cytochrome c oxidase cbb3-type subunit 2
MPAYPWLEQRPADDGSIVRRMRALQMLGHPYSDDEIASASAALEGRTELDAVVAYLQSLGLAAPAGEEVH